MKRITVLLAEDFMLLREGLRALLANEADIDVVGEAETGRQAVRLATKLSPDVVVMDISMPLLNGLEATRQIHRACPSAKVLILSAHGDKAFVEQAVTLGAAGYVTKQTASEVLSKAIRKVHGGETAFDAGFSPYSSVGSGTGPAGTEPFNLTIGKLSSREMEVIQLIAEGSANKQIAAELGISIKTVEKHRGNLMQKLNIHETAGLTRYAITVGIVSETIQTADWKSGKHLPL
ncbi:MAG: DNA-binding response regulator [Lentisphaerae bacterium RIFOXYC12_FULL_60_16]|nr:MAG: DNA-binding response regulator [Lentisphaerae bacterium RIFOXYC12_FULL_60_16]OGV81142.1 MAG: DNA-binding response regulator [Lentisphaerae bacterium RIFOXYB12_FULL_60_10]